MNQAAAGPEHPPGVPAPVAGTYEQLNVFGSRTGERFTAAAGDTLPAAPRGFTWILVRPAAGEATDG